MVGLGVAQALVSGSAGYAVLYLILAPVWLLILTMILRCVTRAGLDIPATLYRGSNRRASITEPID